MPYNATGWRNNAYNCFHLTINVSSHCQRRVALCYIECLMHSVWTNIRFIENSVLHICYEVTLLPSKNKKKTKFSWANFLGRPLLRRPAPLKRSTRFRRRLQIRWLTYKLQHYTNIGWCRGQHWKILPRSCVMLPEGRRPEGNITQLWVIIFQCWSRLTVDICLVIAYHGRQHCTLCLTGLFKPVIHTLLT